MSAVKLTGKIGRGMDELRLAAWCEGRLSDASLTDDEIEWLQIAAFEAVVNKKCADSLTPIYPTYMN
jgi:hypothetical protein